MPNEGIRPSVLLRLRAAVSKYYLDRLEECEREERPLPESIREGMLAFLSGKDMLPPKAKDGDGPES